MRTKNKVILVTTNMHQILMFLRAEWKLNSFNAVIKYLYKLYEEKEND